MTSSDVRVFDLTDDERLLLLSGLMEYAGPAHGASVVAPIVGAASQEEFFHLTDRLYAAIGARSPVARCDSCSSTMRLHPRRAEPGPIPKPCAPKVEQIMRAGNDPRAAWSSARRDLHPHRGAAACHQWQECYRSL